MLHPEDAKRIGNWKWRLTHLYKIRDKNMQEVVFKPRPYQKRIASHFPYWRRFLILKARQLGISTLFLLWHLDGTLFVPNTTTCILAHERESLRKLFRIIKFAYDKMPEAIQLADGSVWKKPTAKYDNANELYFAETNSSVYVALEARSDTIHRLHISEAAHIEQADDRLPATLGAVPPDGIVSEETTANGLGGPYFEQWTEAEEGLSDYMPFFLGYQEADEYTLPVLDLSEFKKTLTDEEKMLIDQHRHTPGHIVWRRKMLSDRLMRKKFDQEFPYCAEVAFLTTGRSPFNRQNIKNWIIRQPILSKMEGQLLYWVLPQKGRRYIVGCDAASGRGINSLDQADAKEGGSDFSVIQVYDCETLQLCAQYRGKWPYAKLHEIVLALAREYNEAYVVIEATDHGLTVLNNITDHSNYPHELVHTTQYVDDKSKRDARKWGFYTNLKTRPLILDHLAGLVEDESLVIYSAKVQSEFLRFIIDDQGKQRAMDGYHDDCVLCSAFTLYCIPQALKAGRMTATRAELGL